MVSKEDCELWGPLARNLAAAFIAWQCGNGLDYVKKRYCDGPIGEGWIHLAKHVYETSLEGFRKEK